MKVHNVNSSSFSHHITSSAPIDEINSKTTAVKQVGLYYLLTFAFTWIFWGSQALYYRGIVQLPQWFVTILTTNNPAAWGPSLVAFLLTFIFEGRSGVIKLFRRGYNRDFKKSYGIFAILLLPTLIGGAMIIGIITSNHHPELIWMNNYLMLLIMPIVIFFIAGPLQEEFGWRGFVQTKLLTHYNKWLVGVFIGFTWALWHLPLFWVPGVFGYYNEPMFGIFVSTIALSVIMVWLYERTERSLLPTLFFHTMFNASHILFPVLGNDIASLWYLILLVGTAAILVIHDTLFPYNAENTKN